MVEHNLAKVGVASSSLVSRSKFPSLVPRGFFVYVPGDLLLAGNSPSRLGGRVVMQRPAKPSTPVREFASRDPDSRQGAGRSGKTPPEILTRTVLVFSGIILLSNTNSQEIPL